MKNSKVGDLLVASTMVEGTVLQRGVCLLVHDDNERAIGVMLNRPLQTMAITAASGQEPRTDGNRLNSADIASVKGQVSHINGRHASTPKRAEGDLPTHVVSSMSVSQSSHANNNGSLNGPNGELSAQQMLLGSSLYFGGPLSGPVVAIHGSAELAEAEAGDGIFMAAQRDHLETLLDPEQTHPYRLIVGHLGWTQTQLKHEIAEGLWHRMPATSDILWTDDGLLWPSLIRRATSQTVSRWVGVEHVADAHLLN